MNLSELETYMSRIEVSTRGASGNCYPGLPDDEDMEIDMEQVKSDAKIYIERYLIGIWDDEIISHEGYEEFLGRTVPLELELKYEGLYEVEGTFELSSDLDYNKMSNKQIWFSELYFYHMQKYAPRGKHCERCFCEIYGDAFVDRGMCADCLNKVYGCVIGKCTLCCDVNYVGNDGRCVVCGMNDEVCPICTSTLDEESFCYGCGYGDSSDESD